MAGKEFDVDNADGADLIAFWNSHTEEECERVWFPYMLQHRDAIPADHPVQQLLDRWDAEAKVIRRCPVCDGDRWDHESWCPHAIDWTAAAP